MVMMEYDFSGLDAFDTQLSYLADQEGWSKDTLKALAVEIENGIKEHLLENYDRPQSKKSGTPIRASGSLGDAIVEDYSWTIDLSGTDVDINWAPDPDATDSNDGTPWGKLFHIDAGSSPMGEGSDQGVESMSHGYYQKDKTVTRKIGAASAEGRGGRTREAHFGTETLTARSFATSIAEGTSHGNFRRAIMEWAAEKGISNWSAIAVSIANKGTQPSNPPFMVGGNSPALFTDFNFRTLTPAMEFILDSALDRVLGNSFRRKSPKVYARTLPTENPKVVYNLSLRRYQNVVTGRIVAKGNIGAVT